MYCLQDPTSKLLYKPEDQAAGRDADSRPEARYQAGVISVVVAEGSYLQQTKHIQTS